METTVRQGRALRVIDALENYPYGRVEGEEKAWYTVRQLAKMMGLKPSVYARLVIADLERGNVLEMREGFAANGAMRFEYSLNARFKWSW